jgi:uncharacterized protein YegL
MDTIRTYVALILDRSGSMKDIREKALNDFNEQIQTLKSQSNEPKEITKKLLKNETDKPVEIMTKLTTVTFADTVKFLTFNEEINIAEEMKKEDYVPNGSTALLDAIGETIDRFTAEIPEISQPDAGVLFLIVTDGDENASRRYGGANKATLKKRIKELQDTGRWTITFMGTEEGHVWEAAEELGLSAGNTMNWVNTNSKGVAMAAATRSLGTKNYMSERILHKKMAVQDFYASVNTDEAEKLADEKLLKDPNSKWSTLTEPVDPSLTMPGPAAKMPKFPPPPIVTNKKNPTVKKFK